MKKAVIVVILLFVLTPFVFSANPELKIPSSVFKAGEVLQYKVKWSFIRVGTLRLINEGLNNYQGKNLYLVRIFIDSAPNLPFVTIHDEYYVYLNQNSEPHYFVALEAQGDYVLKTEYWFTYSPNTIKAVVNKVYPDRSEFVESQTYQTDAVYRDVLSLLYFARGLSSMEVSNLSLPTFVVTGKDSCFFEDSGKIRQESIAGEQVPSYYLAGRVKFIGIAGIKDDFQGWFSIDPSHIPLKAKMKAFFGSVTLELEHAENWAGHRIFYAELLNKLNQHPK